MNRKSFFLKTILLYFILSLLVAAFFIYKENHADLVVEAVEPEPVTVIEIPEVQVTPIHSDKVIVDAAFSFEEAVAGIEIPPEILADMVLVEVRYLGFDSLIRQGQVLIASNLAPDIQEIFEELLAIRFPIESVIPISAFGWSDSLSMAHNNSSGFNYRYIRGSRVVSDHSKGRAIDINPMQNPHFIRRFGVLPPNAIYDPNAKGTFTADSEALKIFRERGWRWGGRWREFKDYQHFYKR